MVTRFAATDNRLADGEPLYFGSLQEASMRWDGSALLIQSSTGGVTVAGADTVLGADGGNMGFYGGTAASKPHDDSYNQWAAATDVGAALEQIGLVSST